MAFLDLIDGSSFAYDYSKETYLYEKFAEKSNVFNKTNAKYERAKLLYNSWVLCVWYVGISLIIIYMIKLLKYDYLELNLFIICVPYLALLITLFSNISGFFISLNHASDSTIALLDFLALAPPQIIGSNQTTLVKGTLKLDNATILAGNKPLLNNVSLCVKKGQIAVLEFKEKSAFLALCSVLRRKSALDKGTISIDDINIKDFEKQTYTNNLTIISQPYYLAGSTILEFFKTTNASQNKIESFLKQTGIKALLKKEKLSLNSPLNGVLNKDLLFVLNTVRAYLDGAEIMAFFGLHFFANAPYKKFFDRLLSKIKKDRTIIVLSTSFANILPSFYYKIDRLGNLKSTN